MKRIVLLFLLISLSACSNTNNAAVTPTLTVTVAFTSTPTPKPLESPTPSINSEYQSLQTLFDAQKVSYTIQDRVIVVDDASTQIQESIILSPESGKVIETNDGLATNVVTAFDKNKNRMVFVEGYGWVKDVETSKSTLDNRIKIPFSWTQDKNRVLNTVLNTIVSLHYAENPTIPSDVVDPHYWITTGYYGGPVLYLSPRPLNGSQVDPEYSGKEAKRTLVWSGVFETTAPNEQNTIVLAQTRKNPTEERPEQLINLFVAFDVETYKRYETQQGENSVIREIVETNRKEIALLFSPPKGFDWAGQYLEYGKQFPNPTVATLYDQGEIFSLLSSEDQRIIFSKLGTEKVASDYSSRIPFIPLEFALRIFYPAIMGW